MTTARCHLIIPRVDPQQMGLTELYQGIESRPPATGVTRKMLDTDLERLHPHWYKALRILQAMGCVQWDISREAEDLRQASALQTRSVRPAST